MQTIQLRQWRESDLGSLAEMNRDPEVMRYFPSLLTPEQSEAAFRKQQGLIAGRGWGIWVIDVDGRFAGVTGLSVPGFEAAFMPCVEIGWRLRREYWGQGIAYRAALQALDYAFGVLRLPEVISFTAVVNVRSRRLMERLGFIRDPGGDFDHPSIPEHHELRRHVLYRKPARSGTLR